MAKSSLIIPAYYATDELRQMTAACVDSLKYGRPDEVLVIEDTNGSGYAHTVNRGLKQATGDVLIIANNDLTFTPGWLQAILNPLDIGYHVSSIVSSDQGWETRDEITEWNRFGCLWAMKREVYDTVGPMSEEFGKAYFEDTDYYLRVKQAGFKIAKNWAVLVEHKGGATVDALGIRDEAFEQAQAIFKTKYGFII